MKTSPFKDYDLTSISYNKFIARQISDMDIGESRIVDIGKKRVASTRVVINYLQNNVLIDWRFKTKMDNDGNLWVLRVK